MMEAKKKNIIQKIEKMIGNTYLYRGRKVRVKTYAVVDGQVRIINKGNTIMFPEERIEEELDQFMEMDQNDEEPEKKKKQRNKVTVHEPDNSGLDNVHNDPESLAKSLAQNDTSQMKKMEMVLMHNIERLQEGEVDVETSQQINDSVKVMLDMSKQKLKMVQEIRKAKKMGG